MEIQGATALVTGASRRIGTALALALASNGCGVAIHYNTSHTGALETKDRVRDLGVDSEVIQADLANSSECERLWKEAVDAMGTTPNILVNNASFFARARLNDVSADAFDHAIAVNVRAPHVAGTSNEPGVGSGWRRQDLQHQRPPTGLPVPIHLRHHLTPLSPA